MKLYTLVFAMFLTCYSMKAQVGIGTSNPNSASVLELSSKTKGFLPTRLTTAERNAIVSPVAGLIIYNSTKNCLEWYNGTVWYNGCGNQDGLPSSGGTAIVSSYSCGTASVGTLEVGTEASGVTQTITASVDKIGTYAISATANGVTFSGSGTFSDIGSQNIVLTATGTLTATGSTSYVLNTTPNCSFIRSTVNSTSGGTAIVTGYNCAPLENQSIYTEGALVQGIEALAAHTISVNVATIGTYEISTTSANGLTFSDSGNFYSTGENRIDLYAAGIPVIAGTNSFTLKTTPNCSFNRATISSSTFTTAICDGSAPTTVVPITTKTGKTWMDRNLGASRQATSQYDYKAYGCLYQWGRGNDGHASMKWYSSFTYATPINGTTASLSTNDVPGHSLFIITKGKNFDDWRSNQNDNLWQGINGINNPCPTGYRIPTFEEFKAETKSDGFNSNTLKFAGAGLRSTEDGGIKSKFSMSYHTSTIFNNVTKIINTVPKDGEIYAARRAEGEFVRCIKD
jgi:hypothetical protein